MKTIIKLTLILIMSSNISFAQEKLETFKFYESEIAFNEGVKSETATKKASLKGKDYILSPFESNFLMVTRASDNARVLNVLNKYKTITDISKIVKLGVIQTAFIRTETTSPSTTGKKDHEVITVELAKITVYYRLGCLVLVSEDLKQDGHHSPVHQVYIPSESVVDFMKSFE